MIRYNPAKARDAVQFLVDSPYSARHIKKLRSLVQKPRALPFREEAEVLNELLVIGRQSQQAMENLIAIAEQRRDNRAKYQRGYMAAKRARERKTVQLETMLRGRPLSVDEAVEAVRHQQAVWKKEREQAIEGIDDWTKRNVLIQAFWAQKDRELDELLEEAQRTLDKVLHRRRVVEVKPKKDTLLGQKLRAAIGGTRKKVCVASNQKPH